MFLVLFQIVHVEEKLIYQSFEFLFRTLILFLNQQ